MQRVGILALVLIVAAAGLCEGLSVGAFNIKIFGKDKFEKQEVVKVLSQIVQRYDIVLIQEIRDNSKTVIHSFLEVVNRDAEGVTYALEVSDRLGRSKSKEQYAFMYRTNRVEIVSVFQYDDIPDSFERAPFCVLVRAKDRAIPEFFLVGIHIHPYNVCSELNALVDVYEEAVYYFGNNRNGIILGDFNADCSYLGSKKESQLTLMNDPRFSWLIGRDTKTTLGGACAYDRIVVAGDVRANVVPNSTQVFLFDKEYGLTPDEASKVSDHYPIEFQLAGK